MAPPDSSGRVKVLGPLTVPTFRALWIAAFVYALLSLVASDRLGLDSVGYGVLRAGLGIGSVAAAFFIPGLRDVLGSNRTVLIATLLFGAGTVAVATSTTVALTLPVLAVVGAAWIGGVATLNGDVQSPPPRLGAHKRAVRLADAPIRVVRRGSRDQRSTAGNESARAWSLYVDRQVPGQLVEVFSVGSWGDHLQQHNTRPTQYDDDTMRGASAIADSVTAHHLLQATPDHHPPTPTPHGTRRHRREHHDHFHQRSRGGLAARQCH